MYGRIQRLILGSFFIVFQTFGTYLDYSLNGPRIFAQCVKKKFFLHDIIIDSDIAVLKQDLLFLTGLKLETQITVTDVDQACFYLKKSNRFKSIKIAIKHEKNRAIIYFKLRSQWLLSYVSIGGVLLGKEALKQRYLLNPGEPFDYDKHRLSLKRYRSYFQKRGYVDVVVRDELKWNEQEKIVVVTIHINKGSRFIIKKACCTIQGLLSDQDALAKRLKEYVAKRLKYRIYKATKVNEIAQDLKIMLLRHGFPVSTINLLERRANKKSIDLEIVIDIPSGSYFCIRGNKRFTYEQLIKYITLEHVFSGQPSAPFLINTLKQWYKNHGFLQCVIEANQTKGGWDIYINEGQQIKIQNVVFHGVKAFGHEEIKRFFKPLFIKDYLDENFLDQACDALLDLYVQHGFWDVEIDEKEFIVDKDFHVLHLTIDEGKQRILQNIVIDGDLSHALKIELLKIIRPSVVPCLFDLAILEHQKDLIVSFLKKKHIEAAIEPLFNKDAGTIELTWKIDKKVSTAFFGNTIITGVPALSYKKIERELAYVAGDPWDRRKIHQTFSNLRDLNMFKSIRLFPLQNRDPLNRRPVVLDLVADDPLELQGHIGFIGGNKSQANTYKVGASVLYKNITHHADTVSFSADLTRYCRDIVLQYRYPHVGGLPFSFSVQAMSKKYDQLCYTNYHCKLYTISEFGGIMNFHLNYKPVAFDVNGGMMVEKISNLFLEGARAIDFAPCLIGTAEPYLLFEPQLALEYVDDLINPKKGIITRVYSKVMIPLDYRTHRLVRVLFEQSFFIPFNYRLVGALRGRIGHIFTTSFNKLIPSERFYLGGPCTIRSYQQDFVPPVVTYVADGKRYWVPQGSRTMASLNVELRCMLTQRFGAVLFYDFGCLKNEINNKFCHGNAFGGGLRYVTPLGPLRFDIGWKGRYFEAERSSLAWFLTIGHAF